MKKITNRLCAKLITGAMKHICNNNSWDTSDISFYYRQTTRGEFFLLNDKGLLSATMYSKEEFEDKLVSLLDTKKEIKGE